jgi:hypothetical protein
MMLEAMVAIVTVEVVEAAVGKTAVGVVNIITT